MPFGSTSSTFTSTSSPRLNTSSTRSMRLPPPILEMWSRPSRPGRMFTNAPNLVMFTTRPGYTWPTSAVGGLRMSLIWRSASSIEVLSTLPMVTVPIMPSSSTEMSAPVSAWMALMTLPFGPMTSPILSIGISKLTTFGAVSPTSARGSAMAFCMTSRIARRASLACCSAWARTSAGRPSILVSSCRAVTNSDVPATLKSMSPKASSVPRMSVRVVYLPSS